MEKRTCKLEPESRASGERSPVLPLLTRPNGLRPLSQPGFPAHLTCACSASPRPRVLYPKVAVGHYLPHRTPEHTPWGLLQKSPTLATLLPGLHSGLLQWPHFFFFLIFFCLLVCVHNYFLLMCWKWPFYFAQI